MSNQLKFIAVYKISTLKLVCYQFSDTKEEDQIKNESSKVAIQIKSINLNQEERQKINTNNGSWFCRSDDKDLTYLILTVSTYPERHAYGLITELQNEFAKLGNYQSQDEASLKLHIKRPMKELCTKYNDLASIDKIYQAQEQVNKTQVVMEDNVKKMLQNQQDLDVLSNKADTLNVNAQSFAKNAEDLASIMYWRNMKLKIMIALIVIAGLMYVMVPIIIQVSAK
ncbi:hypothetical protein pb186bvf_005252 [Paramecium bursaria]